MAFPIRYSLPRGPWTMATAMSTDDAVFYASGNIVSRNGEWWLYTGATNGLQTEPGSIGDMAWTQISPAGVPTPTPSEHFSFTLDDNEAVLDPSSTTPQTVTATMGVNPPFTYTGYSGASVSGPTTVTIPTANQSGTGTTFQFDIPLTTAGTYRVTANIASNNASGDAQPRHPVSATFTVDAAWYAGVSTQRLVPLSVANLPNQGAYSSGVSVDLTAITDGRIYIALPTVTGRTYTFRSGLVFLDATTVNFNTAGYTLYDLGELTSGTITVEVTNG